MRVPEAHGRHFSCCRLDANVCRLDHVCTRKGGKSMEDVKNITFKLIWFTRRLKLIRKDIIKGLFMRRLLDQEMGWVI